MSESLQLWANVSQVASLFIATVALVVQVLSWLFPNARLSLAPWFQIIRPFLPYIVVAAVFFWIGTLFPASNPQSPSALTKDVKLELFQKIEFDYQDSPIEHGWTIVGADETEVIVVHISDQFVGNAVSINSPVNYGMDFEVTTAAKQFGKVIEFVADLENDSRIYAFVGLKQDNGTTTTGWLKFKAGDGQPQPSAIATNIGEGEWSVPIKPLLYRGGDWLLFQVDLEDAVKRTFGRDGWSFQQLIKFRVRGDLSLDYLSVFGQRP